MENSEDANAESERPDLLARWQPEPEQQTPPKQLAVRQDGGVTDRFTTSGTCGACGRPLALITRHGWEIDEYSHSRREEPRRNLVALTDGNQNCADDTRELLEPQWTRNISLLTYLFSTFYPL
jgi:hypothetical protein